MNQWQSCTSSGSLKITPTRGDKLPPWVNLFADTTVLVDHALTGPSCDLFADTTVLVDYSLMGPSRDQMSQLWISVSNLLVLKL